MGEGWEGGRGQDGGFVCGGAGRGGRGGGRVGEATGGGEGGLVVIGMYVGRKIVAVNGSNG